MGSLRRALAVMLLSTCTLAQEPDPLRSPACTQAIEALQAARAAAGKDAAAGARVDALRQRAAQICLGLASVAPSRPSPPMQSPLVVPAPVISPPAPAAAAATRPSQPSPPLQIPRPKLLTHCDANGCWADDGTHLNLVGPNLIGPHGPCVAQGPVLHCP